MISGDFSKTHVDVFRAGAEVAFDRAAGSHDFIALCPEHDGSFLVLRVEKGRISGGKTRRQLERLRKFSFGVNSAGAEIIFSSYIVPIFVGKLNYHDRF